MAKAHRITIGDITCIVLEEGTTSFPPANLSQRYPNANQAEIDNALQKIGYTEGDLGHYFNTLYIETDGTKILVDTGMGHQAERPQVGQTVPSLKSAGINPEDIDIVYITHFHGDHFLGLLSDGKETFPNARYITIDEEWNYWLSEESVEAQADRIKGILNVVNPLREKFSTVSAGDEIAKGVSIIAIPGHTMGQSGLRIESGDESLLHLVDLLHHTTQFSYPEWHFVWDTDGELAVKTRRAQLGNAINRNMLVMFYHLPFPGLGHVERDGQDYKWIPIES